MDSSRKIVILHTESVWTESVWMTKKYQVTFLDAYSVCLLVLLLYWIRQITFLGVNVSSLFQLAPAVAYTRLDISATFIICNMCMPCMWCTCYIFRNATYNNIKVHDVSQKAWTLLPLLIEWNKSLAQLTFKTMRNLSL